MPDVYGLAGDAQALARTARLSGIAGVPAPLQDALTVLAAGGTDAAAIARGHQAFGALLLTMSDGRRRRLLHAGFSAEQALAISFLHTPNFM